MTDLIASTANGGPVGILRNLFVGGNLLFAAPVYIQTPNGNPIGMALSDVNGKPDLVVASQPSNIVAVLHNRSTVGAITFSGGITQQV